MVGLLRICVAVSDVSDRRFGSRTLVRATTLAAKDRVVLVVWNVAGGVRAAEANLDQAGRMEKSRVRNFTGLFIMGTARPKCPYRATHHTHASLKRVKLCPIPMLTQGKFWSGKGAPCGDIRSQKSEWVENDLLYKYHSAHRNSGTIRECGCDDNVLTSCLIEIDAGTVVGHLPRVRAHTCGIHA